jgi:hypothetical protein
MADFAVAAATLYRRGGGLHGMCNSMPLSCTRLGVDLADFLVPGLTGKLVGGPVPGLTGKQVQIHKSIFVLFHL